MPHLAWSRLLFFLTFLGAVFTLASWLGVRGRLILLVLVGLLAVQAAPVFLIHAWSAARHRRRVLESIASIGGRITSRLAADPRVILAVDLSGTDLSELKWESFHALGELESLDLADTAFSDEELDHLSRLRSLRRLCLDKTAVTDAALSELRAFSHLKTVSLNDTQVTEDGVLLFHHAQPQVRVLARHLDFSDEIRPLQDQPHDTVF